MLLPGRADGTFDPPVEPGYGDRPGCGSPLRVLDLDGDGILDVMDCHQVFLGLGDGSFARVPDTPRGWGTAVGDFDEDGTPDLAILLAHGSLVVVFPGRGDGTFHSGHPFPEWSEESGYAAATGDFNRDGRQDLIVDYFRAEYPLHGGPAKTEVGLQVLLGRPGGFAALPPIRSSKPVIDIAVADFDGDGILDLAVRPQGVRLGRGDGTFSAPRKGPLKKYIAPIAAGDFDGDGRADLLVADPEEMSVHLLAGAGDGGFRKAAPLPLPGYAQSIVLADLNGDGRPDFVVNHRRSGVYGPIVYESTLYVSEAGGGYRESQEWPVDLWGGFAFGDLDGDGKPDLAATSSDGNSILVRRGRGDGTFDHGTPILLGYPAHPVAIADLDADGHLDILTSSSKLNALGVLPGTGEGAFGPLRHYLSPIWIDGEVLVADFTGDGYPEVFATNTVPWWYPDWTVFVNGGFRGGRLAPSEAGGVFPAVGGREHGFTYRIRREEEVSRSLVRINGGPWREMARAGDAWELGPVDGSTLSRRRPNRYQFRSLEPFSESEVFFGPVLTRRASAPDDFWVDQIRPRLLRPVEDDTPVGGPPAFWWRSDPEYMSRGMISRISFTVCVGRVIVGPGGREHIRWRRFRVGNETTFGPDQRGYRRLERLWRRAPPGDLYWYVRARFASDVAHSELRRLRRP
jgi:hypothetical protein